MNTPLIEVVHCPPSASQSRSSILTKYEAWLETQSFSPHTKRNYLSQIHRYLQFTSYPSEEVLIDPAHYRSSIANYITHLRDSSGSRLSSINTTMTAIEKFYRFLGLATPVIKRERSACSPPRMLTPEDKANLLAVLATASPKERAVALLFLSTGIRLSECAALNISDALLTCPSGEALICVQKNGAYRNLPVDQVARSALLAWLAERNRNNVQTAVPALFVNNLGRRMSNQGLDLIIRKIGIKAHIVLSAQVLRDTFLTELARQSTDAIFVARIAGHVRLDSTRKYFTLAASPTT